VLTITCSYNFFTHVSITLHNYVVYCCTCTLYRLFPGGRWKCRSGKIESRQHGWKMQKRQRMESRKKRKVGPIRYQRLEQSMIGYCDNYCKDTKAVPEKAYMPTAHQSSILDQCIWFSVIRMPLSRWPAFVGWYQIISETVKYQIWLKAAN